MPRLINVFPLGSPATRQVSQLVQIWMPFEDVVGVDGEPLVGVDVSSAKELPTSVGVMRYQQDRMRAVPDTLRRESRRVDSNPFYPNSALNARMYAGPRPQQPPTMRTPRSTQRCAFATRASGVKVSSNRQFGGSNVPTCG